MKAPQKRILKGRFKQSSIVKSVNLCHNACITEWHKWIDDVPIKEIIEDNGNEIMPHGLSNNVSVNPVTLSEAIRKLLKGE